jgi:hypothetical protein
MYLYLIDMLTEIVYGGCLVKTQYKEDSCINWDSQQINIFFLWVYLHIFNFPESEM